MTCPLVLSMSFSEAWRSCSCLGNHIRPSLTVHPLCWENWTTAPSESRKKRFLALLMGTDPYAFSEHEAISARIVPIRT